MTSIANNTTGVLGRARLLWLCVMLVGEINFVKAQTTEMVLNLTNSLGPMNIGNLISLSQGGLSEDPMWADRLAEIRALHPSRIRLFVQEYFKLLPATNQYHWTKLDESVDLIERAGAQPLLDITIRPKILYPTNDPRIMYPASWEQWDTLISEIARHYRDRVRYWEIGDECEIGEISGCPYACTFENYCVYYQHTAEAIQKGNPDARVGGPATPNFGGEFLRRFLSFCNTNKVPLNFVSWHVYSNDPNYFQKTIKDTKRMLVKYPGIETFLGEWNISLETPNTDPRFQPCFIVETVYRMKESGLDFAGYYH